MTHSLVQLKHWICEVEVTLLQAAQSVEGLECFYLLVLGVVTLDIFEKGLTRSELF